MMKTETIDVLLLIFDQEQVLEKGIDLSLL